MSWIRRETEKETVQYICPHCHDYHEFREDFGERTFSENYIFCRRCGARNGTGNAPTITPPNEPLTQADLDGMDYDKVWIDYEDGTGEWAIVCRGYIYSIDTLEGAGFDFKDYMKGEKLEPHGYKAYRRPLEGENNGE